MELVTSPSEGPSPGGAVPDKPRRTRRCCACVSLAPSRVEGNNLKKVEKLMHDLKNLITMTPSSVVYCKIQICIIFVLEYIFSYFSWRSIFFFSVCLTIFGFSFLCPYIKRSNSVFRSATFSIIKYDFL